MIIFLKELVMLEKYKDAVEVLDLGLSLGRDIHESLADDGKITFGDALKFTDSLQAVVPAVEGIENVPSQFSSMMADSEALVELSAHVLAKLPNIGEKWKTVAVESFNIGLSVLKIVEAFKQK